MIINRAQAWVLKHHTCRLAICLHLWFASVRTSLGNNLTRLRFSSFAFERGAQLQTWHARALHHQTMVRSSLCRLPTGKPPTAKAGRGSKPGKPATRPSAVAAASFALPELALHQSNPHVHRAWHGARWQSAAQSCALRNPGRIRPPCMQLHQILYSLHLHHISQNDYCAPNQGVSRGSRLVHGCASNVACIQSSCVRGRGW